MSSYLQCNCCKLPDPSSIVTSLPDVSVVYKLHLECGRLINLYDWLQAFIAVVDPEEAEKYSTQNGKPKIDSTLQYPFIIYIKYYRNFVMIRTRFLLNTFMLK